ncbi:hypothetical protein [Nocardioides alpinus]|uniref:2TM domain-containing protein n=1 Tax=Nocardioides alpinus TaxID=748909 RepID=A0ABX4R1S2_9ACTN|nr:hypothetical protein [Nocardioides alpinus]PKH44090.1 hypothetical protein CXG46_00555 [Nocardioides alpinus]
MTTPGDEGRTELAWREIVQNYGERPVLGDDESEKTPEPEPVVEDVEEPDGADAADEVPAAERFQPPVAPPFPRPRTWQRGVAWSGIFVAPALALLLVLFSVHVHPLFGWALVLWPIGGFLYLVREMPRSPRDPWDDGSRI